MKRSNKYGTTVGSIKGVHCHYFKVRPVIIVLLFFSSLIQLQDLTMAAVLSRRTGAKELKTYARKWLWLIFEYKVKGENKDNGVKKSVSQHSIRVVNKSFFLVTMESFGFCNSVCSLVPYWLTLHWFHFLQWFIILHHFSNLYTWLYIYFLQNSFIVMASKDLYGFVKWEFIRESSLVLQTLIGPMCQYVWHSTTISLKVLATQITSRNLIISIIVLIH